MLGILSAFLVALSNVADAMLPGLHLITKHNISTSFRPRCPRPVCDFSLPLREKCGVRCYAGVVCRATQRRMYPALKNGEPDEHCERESNDLPCAELHNVVAIVVGRLEANPAG